MTEVVKPERIQNRNLKPVTGPDHPTYKKMVAGRDRYNERRAKTRKRYNDYHMNIADFKADQLATASDEIANNAIPNPAEMLIGMIKEAKLILADPELTRGEYHKERQMYLSLYKEYAALTGANAPTAQSMDMNVRQEETKTPEDIREELILLTNEMRGN